MAGKGIMGLLAGGSKGSAGASSEAPDGPDPLDEKAAVLERFWGEMKAGDFSAAAMSFQEAYDICAEAHSASEDDLEMPELGGEEGEMEL